MKPKQQSEPEWLRWLRNEMHLTRDLELVIAILQKQGLSDDVISAGLQAVRPRDNAFTDGKLTPPPLIRRAPPKLRKVDTNELELYTLDDFLSAKECARIVALTSHHLQPSSVARDPGDTQYRNSTTCALAELRSPMAAEVDSKICRTIGIQPSYGEGIQAQRYDVGQQFKPHCDHFEPGSTDFLRFCSIRGNRTWTVMIYLNDGMEGGATRFTKINHAFTPKVGMAVLWNNLHADGTPNQSTQHCGEPVTRGHKVIITKWFRTLGDGPVYY